MSNDDASTLSTTSNSSSDGPEAPAVTGGNVLTSAATELLLKKAPETAAMSERLKQALADKPALNDVLDDDKFFKNKQITPEQECFPKDFEELVHYIEVRPFERTTMDRTWVCCSVHGRCADRGTHSH